MPGDPRAPASRRESRGTEAAGDCGGSNDSQLIDDGAVVGPAPAILEAVRVYTAARPLQPVQVRDDEDLLEVVADAVDRFDEAIAAFGVLRAEAFVDDEGLQSGARAAGQQLREGDTDGEVGAERLAAAEELVLAGAGAV